MGRVFLFRSLTIKGDGGAKDSCRILDCAIERREARLASHLGQVVKPGAKLIDRTAWNRAVFLAAMLHGAVGIALFSRFVGPLKDPIAIEPVAVVQSSGGLNLEEAAPAEDEPQDLASGNAVAVEPGSDYVAKAAQAILSAKDRPVAPGALSDLEKKARLVEELSSPEEISRIAEGVRAALGVKSMAPESGGSPSRGFDVDHCVVASAERFEQPDSLEIRETLRDRAGRVMVIAYIRRMNSTTGGVEFVQVHIEGDGERQEFAILPEEFAEAEARQRPYQIINRFGLLKQIHDQAVLPLLDKFSEEADAPEPEPTTGPAAD